MSNLNTVLQRVADIAKQAGISGDIHPQPGYFVAGFELPEQRSQIVYVRPKAGVEDHSLITVFSPCHVFKRGFLSGIGKSQCIELLQLNEKQPFARFGMWDDGKEQMIVASVDHLLETLDPSELRSAMWYVAMAADQYEKQHGKDDF
ncbi:MAG: hypothetical protein KDB14_17860 [Planctomycetales bacterium]|nr:hypothetical protein [Planctomycetales bacterium]